MNDAIEAKLVGPAKTKQRRTELLADISQALANGGSQAVTDEMTRRIDTLANAFAGQIQNLKKQL